MVLYARICMRTPSRMDRCVKTFQRYLHCPFEEIKLLSLDILYDLCTYHLHHFEPIIPTLFTFLLYPIELLRYKTAKLIMKLVSTDQLKFMDLQYYQFIALLVDPNFPVRYITQLCMKDVYLKKYDNYVGGQFVQTIVFLNYYEHHPLLKIAPEDLEILRQFCLKSIDRYKIYLFLFTNLSEELQLNVTESVAKEILMPILNGTMAKDSPSLDVLTDALTVMSLLRTEDTEPKEPEQRKDFIAKFLKSLLGSFTRGYKKFSKAQKHTLGHVKFIINALMQMLFNVDSICRTMMENVFHTTITISRKYRTEIVDLVLDGDSLLVEQYKKFNKFFQDNVDSFDFSKGEWNVELNFGRYVEEEKSKQEMGLRDIRSTSGVIDDDLMPF